jgi:hypothetical protein
VEIHLKEKSSRAVAWGSTIATVPQAAVPERAPFVDYRQAIRSQETVPAAKLDRLHGKDQRRQITTAKKDRCEVECSAVHKHFYGN